MLGLEGEEGTRSRYRDNAIVNEMRTQLDLWRAIANPNDWNVTPTTARLLQHWRSYEFSNQQPFFCQIEAVEAAIWLAEVARGRRQ